MGGLAKGTWPSSANCQWETGEVNGDESKPAVLVWFPWRAGKGGGAWEKGGFML